MKNLCDFFCRSQNLEFWNGLSIMSAKEDSETLRIETLRERIFFAARDGLAITLYALLSELNPKQQSQLLNQVEWTLFQYY